ncbi:MAG TPA: hypothetical protein VGE98_01785 [Thermoanaerobaculia bacterium]
MLQFGAVIGRICLDVAFHQQVFAVAKLDTPFEDMPDLRKILRIDNALDLGREDIMEVARVLRESFPGANRVVLTKVDNDDAVAKVRTNLPIAQFPFVDQLGERPENVQFCGAFGLTCVDRLFRLLVLGEKTGADLKAKLEKPTDFHPKILLSLTQANDLMNLVQTRPAQIAALHEAKWIVPEKIACSAGYSPDATTLYASQTGLINHLFKSPQDLDALRASGALLGDKPALAAIFNAGIDNARKNPTPPSLPVD